MTINEIRRVIFSAEWSRTDLSGATRQELARMDVQARLGKHIAALQALVIKPRFVQDIADCDYEIAACGRAIADWQELRQRVAA
ncbi:MAG: hypothetical protein IPO08_24990 [Xanthomonadales bacterium]|nr:hypothetical protein [Xanthomonadales bacterium]